MSDLETMRSITTLGAVLLGFLLGQASEWFKSRRKAKKQKESVRRLIELETKNNVSLIQKFWNAILERKENWDSEDGSFLYAQLADQASRIPFPPLTTDAWRANLGEVAIAYTEPELEAMWKLQRELDRILSLHAFFCEAQNERRDASRFTHTAHGSSAMGAIISSFGFSDSVMEPAREFKKLIENISAFKLLNA
ncbi:hypothetical protein [Ottowia sp. VDI28]|uniref:hypothetical protein n=1 Tax=Ottowia sp. VDI28 TaxID=3133968 RepID=UPI003C2D73CB